MINHYSTISKIFSKYEFAMTADEYLRAIIRRESVGTTILASPVWVVLNALKPSIEKWANQYLVDIQPSGSFAKGTAVTSGTDVDLFVSLSSTTKETLEEIHQTLYKALLADGFNPRLQNVSVGVKVGAYEVDIVPGKRQDQYSDNHSLYRRRADTWTKTSINTHISKVRESGRLEEIKILKIWRNQKQLEFPSFYLELVTMQGCYGKIKGNLAANVMETFIFIRDNIEMSVFIDPANTNNRISDDLNTAEKRALKQAASHALAARNWGEIVV